MPISPTTSSDRNLAFPPSDDQRLPSFSEDCSPLLDACSAGASPNRTPLTKHSSKEKSSTLTFTCASLIRGNVPGFNERTSGRIDSDKNNPTAQPSNASDT